MAHLPRFRLDSPPAPRFSFALPILHKGEQKQEPGQARSGWDHLGRRWRLRWQLDARFRGPEPRRRERHLDAQRDYRGLGAPIVWPAGPARPRLVWSLFSARVVGGAHRFFCGHRGAARIGAASDAGAGARLMRSMRGFGLNADSFPQCGNSFFPPYRSATRCRRFLRDIGIPHLRFGSASH